MKSSFAFFVERPLLVNLSMVFVIALGALSLHNAVFSAYPNFDFGAFSITTLSPGASPQDVELGITAVLEEEVLKVDGIKQLRSSSMAGNSTLLIEAPDAVTRDELVWWPIETTLADGQTVVAWAAQAIPDQVLISTAQPASISDTRGGITMPVG